MGLVDAILEHDRARRAGQDAPVPATGGRRIVCVTCTELVVARPSVASRLGLEDEQVLVVAVPGARVPRSDGDVARAVALAAGAAGGTMGGADVLVLGHEPCAFRAPTFAVPGPAPQGESQPTVGDLVRASVAALRASPWMTRTNVHAIVADMFGRLDAVRLEGLAAAGPAAAPGALGGAPTGTIAPSGPVSFFGAAGAAPSLLADAPPPPLGAPGSLGPSAGASPRPASPAGSLGAAAGPAMLVPAGAIRWDAPAPISPSAPGGSGAFPSLGSPAELAIPSPPIAPSSPSAMPTIGALPSVTPTVIARPGPEPSAELHAAEIAQAMGSVIELAAPVQTPPPPPPPRPAPPERPSRPGHRTPQTPQSAPQQGGSSADDPFKRAEEILEKLRREKRR
jgi:hypothetical protein